MQHTGTRVRTSLNLSNQCTILQYSYLVPKMLVIPKVAACTRCLHLVVDCSCAEHSGCGVCTADFTLCTSGDRTASRELHDFLSLEPSCSCSWVPGASTGTFLCGWLKHRQQRAHTCITRMPPAEAGMRTNLFVTGYHSTIIKRDDRISCSHRHTGARVSK